MVQPSVTTKVTAEEAALYDRQIRLWGLESQNRLKNATVLLIGLSGVGAEVAKNLMLVGLKSLTLVDDELVTELDLKTNFLLDKTTSLDKNRAVAVSERCKLLNPLVNVEIMALAKQALLGTVQELIASETFDLVCCVDRSMEDCFSINEACRRSSRRVLFCMGAVNGWFGYCFNDFGDQFEFATEVSVPVGQKSDETNQQCTTMEDDDVVLSDEDEPIPKRPRTSSTTGTTSQMLREEPKRERVIIRKHTSFTPLVDAFNKLGLSNATSGDVKRKRSKALYPVGFYICQILAGFRHQFKRNPSLASQSHDVQSLKMERNAILSTLGDVKIDIPENFASSLFDQVPAVCAIIGGVLSQEAIKAVSQKDEPINNWFFYNPFDCSGAIAKIPRGQ